MYTILLVEDELLLSEEMKFHFEEAGYTVLEQYISAEKALDYLHAKASIDRKLLPNLITMDINLAGEMTGIEAAKIVSEKFPECAVIFSSGYSEKRTLSEAFETKPRGYIIKPFDPIQAEITARLSLHQHDLEMRLAKKNEELELLNKEKDNLMDVAAHDLKEPLTSIMMHSSAILGNIESLSADVIKKRVERILLSSSHMNTMIENVLNINAIEKDLIEPQITNVSLEKILIYLYDSYQERVEETRVSVVMSLILDEKQMIVQSDERMLTQILENLVANAVQQSPKEEAVGIEVEVLQKNGRSFLEVSISDVVPISEYDREGVFEKFSQLSTVKDSDRNTVVMRLYLAKKFIDKLGGSIRVVSEPEQGKTFIVTIPTKINMS